MKIGMLCCWSNMRIYPIYSNSLRKALASRTQGEVAVVTTDCMCFDRGNPVDEDYSYIEVPYLTRRESKTELKRKVRASLYPPLEYLRGRRFAARANDFDVVDFQQSSYAFGYESLKAFLTTRSRAKKVVTLHKLDAIQKEKPELNGIYNKADAVIVFSKYFKQMLVADGVRPSKIFVIHHGASLPQLQDEPKVQAIVFCGSPIPRIKGFEDYVIALRLLREQGIELNTKIYGFFMPDEKEYAEWHAAEQGIEDLLTWQSFANEAELAAEHQKSLMCVIPYTGYAGYFPSAYAMGNGVPIVATDILGHGEYVADTGLLVPPADPVALAAAMERLIKDEALRTQLGANGREFAETNLSWDRVAEETLEVFTRVLEHEEVGVRA